MTPAETEVWQQIDAFAFDPPDARCLFADRVSRENGWTDPFTARAIDEYRRFVFLSVAAGHAIAPSPVVDKVWHEHLLFTRNYWDDLCGATLGRPLHHHPTRGAPGELQMFADWYAQTLESYRRYFGEPAIDIWPAPGTAKSEPQSKVDRRQNWIVPKPRRQAVLAIFAGAAAVALAGCAALAGGMLNPFDLRGPDFLKFWFGLTSLAFVIAGIVRWYERRAPVASKVSVDDPIDIALLAGGVERATQYAIAALHQRGLVRFDFFTLTALGAAPKDLSDLERRLFEASVGANGVGRDRAQFLAERVLAPRIGRLKRAGLLMTDETVSRLRWRVGVWAFLPTVVGIAKIMVGVSRNRPVGFLVFFTVVATATALGFLVRPRRTRRGDRVLTELRQKRPKPVLAGQTDLAGLAVALYGTTMLAGTEFADVRQYFSPPKSGGSSSSSGCSGSSCGSSGGSSGGGGCGGCSGH